MEESEIEEILLNREIYLKAIQKEGIPLKALGFKDYFKSVNKKNNINPPNSRINLNFLRPVIPQEDQGEYLDTIEESVKLIEDSLFKDYNQKLTEKLQKKVYQSNRKVEKRDKEVKKKWAPQTTKPIDLKCARMLEKEKKFLKEQAEEYKKLEKEKKYREMLGNSKFVPKNEYDEECGFDYNGKKVTLDVLARLKPPKKKVHENQEVTSFKIDSDSDNNSRWSGELVEKTSKYVQNLRDKIESDISFRAWAPNLLPPSTIFLLLDKEEDQWSLPISTITHWPQYSNLKEGDICISIEHCGNCECHSYITHHNPDHYKKMVINSMNSIGNFISNYPLRLFTFSKMISFDSPATSKQDITVVNKRLKKTLTVSVSSFRLGAFEIQVSVRKNNKLTTHLLHSKLASGNWPNLNRINRLLVKILSDLEIKPIDNEVEENFCNKYDRKHSTRRAGTQRTEEVCSISSNPTLVENGPIFDFRELSSKNNSNINILPFHDSSNQIKNVNEEKIEVKSEIKTDNSKNDEFKNEIKNENRIKNDSLVDEINNESNNKFNPAKNKDIHSKNSLNSFSEDIEEDVEVVASKLPDRKNTSELSALLEAHLNISRNSPVSSESPDHISPQPTQASSEEKGFRQRFLSSAELVSSITARNTILNMVNLLKQDDKLEVEEEEEDEEDLFDIGLNESI